MVFQEINVARDKESLINCSRLKETKGFPGGSEGKEPAMWETWGQSLGWEDPLKKEVATPSRILAWRIPLIKEPGRL